MPLTAARFSDLQTRSNNYLVDTCVISARTETANSAGGWTNTFTARGTVACYVQAKEAVRIGEQSGRLESYTEYTLFIANDGTIAPGDRVVHNGLTYYAQGVVEAKSRRAYLQTKLMLEATNG